MDEQRVRRGEREEPIVVQSCSRGIVVVRSIIFVVVTAATKGKVDRSATSGERRAERG